MGKQNTCSACMHTCGKAGGSLWNTEDICQILFWLSFIFVRNYSIFVTEDLIIRITADFNLTLSHNVTTCRLNTFPHRMWFLFVPGFCFNLSPARRHMITKALTLWLFIPFCCLFLSSDLWNVTCKCVWWHVSSYIMWFNTEGLKCKCSVSIFHFT